MKTLTTRDEHRAPPAHQHGQGVTVTVVQSVEPIDVDAWLAQYVAAILEAEGYPAVSQTEAA